MGSSCRRLDLFFMVGLPYQDYQSVMDTVEYCGELMRRYGGTKKLLPMIAPLAPFIDPAAGSLKSRNSSGIVSFTGPSRNTGRPCSCRPGNSG